MQPATVRISPGFIMEYNFGREADRASSEKFNRV